MLYFWTVTERACLTYLSSMATSNQMNEEVKHTILLNKKFPVIMSLLCSEKYSRTCLTKLMSKSEQMMSHRLISWPRLFKKWMALSTCDFLNPYPVDKV